MNSSTDTRTQRYRAVVLSKNCILYRGLIRSDPLGTIVSHVDRERASPESCLSDLAALTFSLLIDSLSSLSTVDADKRIRRIIPASIIHQPPEAEVAVINCEAGIPRVLIPGLPAPEPQNRLVTPRPDMLWGYHYSTFDSIERMKMASANPALLSDFAPQGERICLPFLAVMYSPRSSLYTARSNCNVALAVCLSLPIGIEEPATYEGLPSEDAPLANVAYGFVVGSEVAELRVGWVMNNVDKGDGPLSHTNPHSYIIKRIDMFVLTDPWDVKRFHDAAQNILDWGKGPRLNRIKKALKLLPARG